MVRTALSVVFRLDVPHLATSCSAHLARVGVVASVSATDGRAADRVAVVVTALRTLTPRRQTVQRRHALRAETTPLVTTRVGHVRRKHVTAVDSDQRRPPASQDDEETTTWRHHVTLAKSSDEPTFHDSSLPVASS